MNNQEDTILSFFIDHGGTHTPCEVQAKAGMYSCPLTSVRRAITNLTDMGLLVKTNVKREGIFGKPCHTWRLADA